MVVRPLHVSVEVSCH